MQYFLFTYGNPKLQCINFFNIQPNQGIFFVLFCFFFHFYLFIYFYKLSTNFSQHFSSLKRQQNQTTSRNLNITFCISALKGLLHPKDKLCHTTVPEQSPC